MIYSENRWCLIFYSFPFNRENVCPHFTVLCRWGTPDYKGRKAHRIIRRTCARARVWFGVHQCSQEPSGVTHTAPCAAASRGNMICASTLRYVLAQGSGTYGSRARWDSFDDGIWLAWYFLNTIVTDETCSVIFLQRHQQHHAAPDVALTVRSTLLKRKFRHLPLFKTVDFA